MLSAKGLVGSKPRQGIRILPEENWNIFDPDLLRWSLEGHPTRLVLREFFQMRIAVEPEAAALGARFARPEHLTAIEAALDRMQESDGDPLVAGAADVDFHVAILYSTDNRFYLRLRDFIRTALEVSIRFTTAETGDYAETVDAHARIYQAIADGNAELAQRNMRSLIDDALAIIEEGAQFD